MKTFHEILAPLTVGWTIIKVEAGRGREGGPAKLTLSRGDKTRTMEIHAGIYEPIIEAVQDRQLGGGCPVFLDVENMLDTILEQVSAYEEANYDVCRIEPLEDVFARRFGFRCVETGQEWWVNISAVKGAPQAPLFLSPESRQDLANHLGQGVIPSARMDLGSSGA